MATRKWNWLLSSKGRKVLYPNSFKIVIEQNSTLHFQTIFEILPGLPSQFTKQYRSASFFDNHNFFSQILNSNILIIYFIY